MDNAPDPTSVFVGGDGNPRIEPKACMHCGNSHVTQASMAQG